MKTVKTIDEFRPEDQGKYVLFARGQGTLVGYSRRGMNLTIKREVDGRTKTYDVTPNDKFVVKESK